MPRFARTFRSGRAWAIDQGKAARSVPGKTKHTPRIRLAVLPSFDARFTLRW